MIAQYQNGNYKVSIFEDGTKIRETEDASFIPAFPEQADCKITNWCDNPICREFCHEKSDKSGVHGDLDLAIEIFKTWNKGIEVAIGGGSTLSHPNIIPFLQQVKDLGMIGNITFNHFHVKRQKDLINGLLSDGLIYGAGLSYLNQFRLDDVKEIFKDNNNLVFHLILGIHSIRDVKFIAQNFSKAKVLLLGYKTFGNGVNYLTNNKKAVDAELYYWFTHIQELFEISNLTLSFDNLSIKQLNLKRFFTTDKWNKFYQGDDGTHSFYMDFVKKEFAQSSTSSTRYKMDKNSNIRDMFNTVKC